MTGWVGLCAVSGNSRNLETILLTVPSPRAQPCDGNLRERFRLALIFYVYFFFRYNRHPSPSIGFHGGEGGTDLDI
jgi:hypothetical protein